MVIMIMIKIINDNINDDYDNKKETKNITRYE